ncbi:MAG: anaerobic ribonucleoside-triphosphate reductase, partial [Candidatus Thorarchaeota archaeon]
EPNSEEYHFKCDECFKKDSILMNYQNCEVYSRIVGYLRPIKDWNLSNNSSNLLI